MEFIEDSRYMASKLLEQKKTFTIRKDGLFGTLIWPPVHCFGTPIWPP